MSRVTKLLKRVLTYRNPLLGVTAALAVYTYLHFLAPAADVYLPHPGHHFHLVSIISAISLGVAIAVGMVGVRQRNLQVIYVALAFVSLATLFSLHGLTTPGFMLGPNWVVGATAQLAVFTTSFWLLISALPSSHTLNTRLAHYVVWLLLLYPLGLLALGVLSIQQPQLLAWVPAREVPLGIGLSSLTIGMALIAGYRYWQSYRYSKFPFQLAMAYTGGWVAVAMFIIATSETFYLGWWLYHVLLLLCVLICVAGLARQYRRPGEPMLALQGLFSSNPGEQVEAVVSNAVRNLIIATEQRDPYTAGHQHRVAQGALRLGKALDLRPEQLRALVQGGVVHDVGKLRVPDAVLSKPGPLSLQERRAIEQHTIAGYEMCARLGFMQDELGIIRWHHERLDGLGYPDHLQGEQIPLLTRILTVSDVFDALTSGRAYRAARSTPEALSYLQHNRGTQFEARLVDVWEQLVLAGEIRSAPVANPPAGEG
ncbi:MAG: HD-GYP domain-containing protein [Anaerolineales bacterium]|nr:HD-GYP domain-containing protein [Anaerolineales bacterium]